MAYFHWDDEAFWKLGDAVDQYRKILLAKAPPDGEPGMREACFNLGDPQDPQTPHISILEWKPGNRIFRHSHPSHRFELLLRGTLETPEGTLTAGGVMFTGPNEAYGPLVAGPDGALTVEVIGQIGEIYMDYTHENTDPELREWMQGLLDKRNELEPDVLAAVLEAAERGHLLPAQAD
jgi:hypothetical protein